MEDDLLDAVLNALALGPVAVGPDTPYEDHVALALAHIRSHRRDSVALNQIWSVLTRLPETDDPIPVDADGHAELVALVRDFRSIADRLTTALAVLGAKAAELRAEDRS